MNRENKLALIIGFTLILVVGVLVSDHLSRASTDPLAELDEFVNSDSQRPISGGLIESAINASVREPDPTQAAPVIASRDLPIPSQAERLAITDPNPPAREIASELNLGDPTLSGGNGITLADASGAMRSILDIYSNSAAPPAVEMSRDFGLEAADAQHTSRETSALEWATVSHVVQAGDNCFRLAERFLNDGERWREIRDANPGVIGTNGELALGATVKIRMLQSAGVTTITQGNSAASTPVRELDSLPTIDLPRDRDPVAAREIVVQPNEVLSKIAQRELGTFRRMDEIIKLNGLDDADDIRSGMTLKLPTR